MNFLKISLSILLIFSATAQAVDAAKAVEATWSGWTNTQIDKCAISFNPIKGIKVLGETAWNNKGWTVATIIGGSFAGYYLNKKFKCWWNTRCANYRTIYDLVTIDMNNTSQNYRKTVEECAAKCQTVYFTRDHYIIELVKDYYDFRNKDNNKYTQVLEVQKKGDKILKYAFGFVSNC